MIKSYPYPASDLPAEIEDEIRAALTIDGFTLVAARTGKSDRCLRVVVRWDPRCPEAISHFRNMRSEWQRMDERSYYHGPEGDLGRHSMIEFTGDLNVDAFLAFAADRLTASASEIAASVLEGLGVSPQRPMGRWIEVVAYAVPIHSIELLELHELMDPLASDGMLNM